MSVELAQLEFRNRHAWRRWLDRHHAASPGVWLVFHKVHTAIASMPYEDSVREALCFGWIDSLVKRLDADRYVRKFTPRRAGSVWSDINRKRWAELKRAGELRPAGLAAAPTRKKYTPVPRVPELPAYIAKALKARPEAWRFFQGLSPTDRRYYVGWIHLAKREVTRQKRLREAIDLLAAGKKLGLR